MEDRPAHPNLPIRLPVFYIAPWFAAALAYAVDLTAGAQSYAIGSYGFARFALVTVAVCAAEALFASAYLIRRGYVTAAVALVIYLVVVAVVVLGFGAYVT